MPPSQLEMQRQLHNYAMEEMRNRGLEEAANMLESRTAGGAAAHYHCAQAAKAVRLLKRDPANQLTDWWADDQPSAVDAERARCAEIARSLGNDHIAAAIELGCVVEPVVPIVRDQQTAPSENK